MFQERLFEENEETWIILLRKRNYSITREIEYMIVEGNILLLTEWVKVVQGLDDEEDKIYEWSRELGNREHRQAQQYRRLSAWAQGRRREEDNSEKIELWVQYFQQKPIGDDIWMGYLNIGVQWYLSKNVGWFGWESD